VPADPESKGGVEATVRLARRDLVPPQGPGKVMIRPICPMAPRRGPSPRGRVGPGREPDSSDWHVQDMFGIWCRPGLCRGPESHPGQPARDARPTSRLPSWSRRTRCLAAWSTSGHITSNADIGAVEVAWLDEDERPSCGRGRQPHRTDRGGHANRPTHDSSSTGCGWPRPAHPADVHPHRRLLLNLKKAGGGRFHGRRLPGRSFASPTEITVGTKVATTQLNTRCPHLGPGRPRLPLAASDAPTSAKLRNGALGPA
jgi:hypothetical protein